MADAGAPAVRISRPTVLLNGQESPTLAQGMLALRVEESVSGISACELAVGNWGPVRDQPGFLYFDRRDIDFGKPLGISIQGKVLFSGRITGLEGGYPEGSPPTLLLLAEDRLQGLRMTRRSRTFTDVSDESVIRRIAGEHGLTADVQLTGPTHRVLAQLNQSDLAFIHDRCRAQDAEVWVEDRKLLVRRRADRTGDDMELGYGHELREFTVTADLVDQASEVAVGGWDVSAKQAIMEAATTGAIQPELGGGDAGGAILGTALAARKERVAHTGPITSAEARARAEALYRRRARSFVRGRGLADTDVRLRVGRRVKLTGLGPLFDGRYYITDARHVFDPVLGMRTEFGVERPGLGRP
jgi:Bacteriophage probable baseplate hub protein